MVYPVSPFTNNLNISTIINLNGSNSSVGTNEISNKLESILKWLCKPPTITSFRVNTIKYSVINVKQLLENILKQLAKSQGKIKCLPNVTVHPSLPDVILVDSYQQADLDLVLNHNEVIVDAACGNAILRGAHVFAPGVMAVLAGTKPGDAVSVYADIGKKCKKGELKPYKCSLKVFVGNGILRIDRKELFRANFKPSGIAVEMTDNLSGCPSLNNNSLPIGAVLLQNIPSILCGHVLNPQPGEVVLDMCASPGNKTSHLAALMENKGVLIALDKTTNKLKQLQQRCQEFSLDCTHSFEFDSTKSCDLTLEKPTDPSSVTQGPPFAAGSFDKVLLDAPCSGLGNRPQLVNTVTDKVVRSYVPLQRKLFSNAVALLKPGGHLVYSTCTLTLGENEGIVAWALDTFSSLELMLATPYLGGPGWPGTKLTEEQLQLVQRFGPEDNTHSIGFFIAHFKNKCL